MKRKNCPGTISTGDLIKSKTYPLVDRANDLGILTGVCLVGVKGNENYAYVYVWFIVKFYSQYNENYLLRYQIDLLAELDLQQQVGASLIQTDTIW